MTTLLELKDLHTFFKTKKGIVKAVNGVSYSVDEGRTLGVVGESGSGKSVSAMSILQLLDGNGYLSSAYAYEGDGKHFEKSGYVAWANYMKTHYVDEGLLTE